jgi:hypothetical protein
MSEQVRVCDCCGEEEECTLASDPYAREIFGEDTEETWWCEDCYTNRCDDI